MNIILTAGILVLLICLAAILVFAGNKKLNGPNPVSLPVFIAILFTSGLDMGLVILPLTEFPQYSSDATFQSIHPLALEFGFWGFYMWSFYFVSSFYFCVIEPKLQFFKKPLVKVIHNSVVVGTCAFTAYLFLSNMKWYFPEVNFFILLLGVALILLLATYSSTDIRYVKYLSVASSWIFFGLCIFLMSQLNSKVGLLNTSSHILEYFKNFDQFIFPMNDYHAFYLFWWFSWCLMIGQFTAQFLGGLKSWQVLLALLILPSLPLALWFSILFRFYNHNIEITFFTRLAMLFVGILFVINSVDSLVRLYSDNLNLTVKRLGKPNYVIIHFSLLFGLVMAFIYTPLKIQWVGNGVILLIFSALIHMFFNRRALTS